MLEGISLLLKVPYESALTARFQSSHSGRNDALLEVLTPQKTMPSSPRTEKKGFCCEHNVIDRSLVTLSKNRIACMTSNVKKYLNETLLNTNKA